MYKTTCKTLKNNIESLTTKLMVNFMFYTVSIFIGSILTNRLLKRTEDLYNNPSQMLFINNPVAQFGFSVFFAKENLLYTSKI